MEAPQFSVTENGETTSVGCGFLFFIIAFIYAIWYPRLNDVNVVILDDDQIINSTQEAQIEETFAKIGKDIRANFLIVIDEKGLSLRFIKHPSMDIKQLYSNKSLIFMT